MVTEIKKKKPKIFYKYKPIDKFLFEIIRTNKFYYSNINELNDFYDLRFQLEIEFIQQLIMSTYLENKTTSEMLKTRTKKDIENHIQVLSSDPNFKHVYHEKLYQKLNTKICCFTTNKFSSSMWSFYAGCYDGVVLEFDLSKDKNLHYLISKVYYLKKVQPIKDIDGMRRACIIKMPEWSREKEWRIIVYGDRNKATFNKECLKSITFGLKVSPKNIAKTINLVKKCKYNNVKFYHLDWFQSEMKRFEYTVIKR